MNSRKEEILHTLEMRKQGMTAIQIGELLNIDRTNASRYLNELAKEQRIVKNSGRPVIYEPLSEEQVHVDNSSAVTFDALVGEKGSLKVAIQQAKAAILYPPRGLHTIIFGDTGTGKSLFAECMYQFALKSQTLKKDAPFVSFNCADYAQNPQLLFGHIFGIKKGAYTGANEDSPGLIAKADNGILFLDEIHRLPPEGQEMLFTFIDKGVYRPLGESNKTYEAAVQIIGATTESSENFLTTFNRRIPMSITLPSIKARSLDERYEIITLFIKQEANRLKQKIEVEQDAIIAFMLYQAEGNIGQIKRDLKLVCAKAFLHYRTKQQNTLLIRKEDLSLPVQKGLLMRKDHSDDLKQFLEGKGSLLSFEPGATEVVWSQDPERNMQVYNAIEEKVTTLANQDLNNVDLEQLILGDVDAYFETYVEELTQSSLHKELLPKEIWQLTSELYEVAEERLERKYNEKARFAFALHLQSTIERLKDGHTIIHPDLNNIRKNFKQEFQVALDLSTIIEDRCQIEIPFDEIGFISMFLSIQVGQNTPLPEKNVEVIVLMHGKQTATSMLETAQELLDTKTGVAFNMSLDMEVQTIYNQLLQYVQENAGKWNGGILLLTDMGSLNSFGDLIYEETGIRTKAVSMTSTMVVLEALRMVDMGRTLEDIYQNTLLSFKAIVKDEFNLHKQKQKKAVVVTCFTGEGVASKLYDRIVPVVDQSQTEVIQMQFIEKNAFLQHIDALMTEYEIKAIAGTVEIDYQNIPFFSAYEIFDNERLRVLKQIVNDEISLEKIGKSLQEALTSVSGVEQLMIQLQQLLHHVEGQMHAVLEPSVDAGIMIHLAFLVDNLRNGGTSRRFDNLAAFQKKYRLECDLLKTSLMPIAKNYQVEFSDDEIAYVVQMIQQNKISSAYALTRND
ncbi:sigma 54-interacting transcriptional regulator [Enterococcus canintestini]|uniref:ArsR family transcriptional regulator n=1 Tax=Enterococcus canintestini TaxID=317010 RepID=A0A267HQK9_9ENTE|nr:sigma-54-dependent transcriptional regulator [Enterococcus canintestini]PAB00649.1 ArsR family transcriptional regulator [Enterococcus canintestini]